MAKQGKKQVAVLGAGAVGVATAVWLQREGHQVTLIDRAGVAEMTSHGNGGVLASCAVVPVTGPGVTLSGPRMLLDPGKPLFLKWGYLPRLLPWLVRYLSHGSAAETKRIADALYPITGDSYEEHRALCAGTPAERYLHACDYIYLYPNRKAFEKERFSWDIRKRHGFKWEEVEREALGNEIPGLSRSIGFAIRLKDHGRISDPGAYAKALAADFEAKGGTFLQTDVRNIRVRDGQLEAIETDGGIVEADAVVVATGAWSKTLLEPLGIRVPLESERGYHIEYYDPSISLPAPVMVSDGKFVITPMEGRLRAAGILEFGGLDAGPSEAPFRFLDKKVREVLPGLEFSHSERWMGHRPATVDSLPLIGEIETAQGVYAALGHHHVGLTGSAVTGRLIAQLISDKKPNIDLANYSPMRFQ